jgi:adenine-specific DNA-methyltransferase
MNMKTSITNNVTKYANDLSIQYNATIKSEEKKKKGQFFTSSSIALFMAQMVKLENKSYLRILDPGSGTGVLIAALVERIIRENRSLSLTVDLYEKDSNIIGHLNSVMIKCQRLMEDKCLDFNYTIYSNDFILYHEHLFNKNFGTINNGKYDLVICNPPYFKVKKDHKYSKILRDYIYGQPNVYFMFMAISEILLRKHGQLIVISPRSYCSGVYFRKFRSKFFENIEPNHFHAFESRTRNFINEKVLQENIILSGFKKQKKLSYITISSSKTPDIYSSYKEELFHKSMVFDSSGQNDLIRIPLSKDDERVLKIFDGWKDNLLMMGIDISTGPVVTFRHKKYLENIPNEDYPLLCMKHVKYLKIVYSLVPNDKSINIKGIEKKLVVDSNNYVIIKRFSSKEQKKRIYCSAFLKDLYQFKKIGFENHLIYLYKKNGSLTKDEVYGLTGFLNSRLVDRFFRIINGNTQVNVSDLKPLPLPSHEFIVKLGKDIKEEKIKFEDVDRILDDYCSKDDIKVLKTKKDLVSRLV